MYKVKRFCGKVIKLVKWFKVLWHDEDWDYIYLMGILSFKLRSMRENNFNRQPDIKRELRVCEILIDRFITKEYSDEKLFFGKDDFPTRYNREIYMKQQDLSYLFKIILRKLQTWWD